MTSLGRSASHPRATTGPLSRRQPEPHQQPAQILALLQPDAAAVNFGNVAHDRKAEPCPGLAAIQPHTAIENPDAVDWRNTGTIVLNDNLRHPGFMLHRDEHAPAAIFRRIFEEIADQLVQILSFDANDQCLVPVRVETRVRV